MTIKKTLLNRKHSPFEGGQGGMLKETLPKPISCTARFLPSLSPKHSRLNSTARLWTDNVLLYQQLHKSETLPPLKGGKGGC